MCKKKAVLTQILAGKTFFLLKYLENSKKIFTLHRI